MSRPASSGAAAAVAFARVAAGMGLRVPAGSAVVLAQALAAVGLARESSVYWAGRAVIARSPEEVPAYDRAFEAFWRGRPGTQASVAGEGGSASADPGAVEAMLGLDAGGAGADAGAVERRERPVRAVRYSAREVLSRKDFAECSTEELAECYRLMDALRVGGSRRRSRRTRPAPRGRTPDLRRTVRRAMRTGGEPLRRAARERKHQRRRVVLVCDVSGSMDPYARALVRFAHAAVSGRARVEAFALGTRLTRMTRALGWRDPDMALSAVAEKVQDRAGGTRIGEGLEALNRLGVARGAVVVVLSDGWDRGEPDRLAEQMARLSRMAHKVVWVNPLKASPGYAPLARGMAAALPYVDDFVEGHSVEALSDLAEVIAR